MAGHEVPDPPGQEEYDDEPDGTRMWLRIYWSYGWLLWLAGIVAAIVLLVTLGMTLSNRDDKACRAHGHQIVATGVGDGEACVDNEWKVVKP